MYKLKAGARDKIKHKVPSVLTKSVRCPRFSIFRKPWKASKIWPNPEFPKMGLLWDEGWVIFGRFWVCSALGLSLDLWNLRKLTQRDQPMLKADSITPDSLLSTCIGQARCMSLKMLDEFSLKLWWWMTVTTPVTCQYSEVKHLGSLLDHI